MPSFAPSRQTTNAVAAVISNFAAQLDDDQVCRLTIFAFASDHGVGQAYWEWRALLRRMVGNPMTGIFTLIAHSASASAGAWTATIAVK